MTLPPSTSTFTVPGAGEVITVTVPGDEKISTLTVPGEGEVITVTIPGAPSTATVSVTIPDEDKTSTLTIPGAGEITTVTVPGKASTVTVPTTVTLPGEDSTITLPVTLPAETVTLPGNLATTTETAPASTVTLPGELSTATTTETVSASTVTVTATATPSAGAGSCSPSANAIVNGDFETPLAGTWSVLTTGTVNLERVNVPGSTFALRPRIDATNSNLPQRLVQAVTLCPGTTYQVSFQARRTTTAGSASVVAYINDVALAGGVVASSSFTPAVTIGSEQFSLASGSTAILKIEFSYQSGSGSAKEVQIDNVAITPVS